MLSETVLKKRKICDWSTCQRPSVWFASLDNLVFCLTHRYEWERQTAGYASVDDYGRAGFTDSRPRR